MVYWRLWRQTELEFGVVLEAREKLGTEVAFVGTEVSVVGTEVSVVGTKVSLLWEAVGDFEMEN